MARPLSTSESIRGGFNGSQARYGFDDGSARQLELMQELDTLRAENDQLRLLCGELEQALQEATQDQSSNNGAVDAKIREYEDILEEKNHTIRELHQQLQDATASLQEIANQGPAKRSGPIPREEELLQLSEQLEQERRQLQEDEQTLMEQMRQMEMSMARERAEMARQRNDLQRLHGEIRHDLERLERNGALQSKMEDLKAKLQDAKTRQGAAPSTYSRPTSSSALPNVNQSGQSQDNSPPSRPSIMGRLFGGGK